MVESIYFLKPAWCGTHLAGLWPEQGLQPVTRATAFRRWFATLGPSTPETPSKGPSGDPRAFDAKSGKLVWRFHAVPQPGEPGNETWGPDGWKDRSGPSAWGGMTLDAARGLLFLPIGNPADSFYGADRP